MATREYFVIGAVWILCVFSFAVWLEKMMKIIIWNYLLTALCLALWPTIDWFISWLGLQDPSIQQTVAPLLTNKTIVILIVYLLMLVLVFAKSRINIDIQVSGVKRVIYFVLAVPMTILSILFTLEIAILWVSVFSIPELATIVSGMPIPSWYQQFLINTPVMICLHAFVTIFLLSTITLFPKRGGISMPSISIEE